MEIHRLVAGPDGSVEFAPMEVYFGDDQADRMAAEAVTLLRQHHPGGQRVATAQRELVVFLSGITRVTDGRGRTVDFGPGDLLLRDDAGGEAHEERYVGDVYHLVLHCPDYDPPVPVGVGARWACEPTARDKFGPPQLSRILSEGEETVVEPLVWPDDLRAAARPVSHWQPVDRCLFVEHAGIAAGPQGVNGTEPQPTTIGWHLTRQRCLYVVLSGQARTFVTNGPSLLRQQGDVQLSEDLTGKGHFNMFGGRGAGLVVFLPDGAFVHGAGER